VVEVQQLEMHQFQMEQLILVAAVAGVMLDHPDPLAVLAAVALS